MKPRLAAAQSTRRRAGILGAGFISEFHIRPLKALAQAEVTAICDADAQKTAAGQTRWGIPHAFHSLPEMLASGEVNVVHVLTPPASHAQAALACIELGCDVFLEKPLTISSAESDMLGLCARRCHRTVGVNQNAVYHPAFLRLVEMIECWRLGRAEHVIACVNVPLRQLSAGQHDHWMFRDFGNIVMEQAPHPLSQIQVLLGPIQSCSASVSGLTQLRTGVPFYDTWQVSLVCERGTAQLFLAFGREYLENSLHVIGQDGGAFVDLHRNILRVADKSRFIEATDNLRDALQNARATASQGIANFLGYGLGFLQVRPPADAFSLSMATSIDRFYEALQQGKEPAMGLDAGAATVRACEWIVQEAARNLRAPWRKEPEHVTGA